MTLWFRLGFRNILKNRRRSLITLSALLVGSTAINLFQGYVADTMIGLRKSAIHGEGLGHLILFKRDALAKGQLDELRYSLTGGELKRIEQLVRPLPAVKLLMPRLDLCGLISNGKQSVIFIGQGVEPDAYRRLKAGFAYSGRGEPIDGTAPAGGQVGSDLAAMLGVDVGDDVVLFSTTLEGHMNAVDMHVRGVYNTGSRATNDKTVLVPLRLARRLYDTEGAWSVSILLNSLDDIPKTRARIEQLAKEANLDIEVKTWKDLSLYYTNVANLFGMIFLFLYAIILVVVVMGVLNTVTMSVMERVREIGALRAFGLRRAGVLRLFGTEALVLGTLGVAGGAVLTVGLAALIQAAHVTYMPPGLSEPAVLAVALSARGMAVNGLLMIGLCGLAALLPARAAARLPIVSALGHV